MENSQGRKAHDHILRTLLGHLEGICSVLDAGSGRTSLTAICETFPDAVIDAVVFPGDTRKLTGMAPVIAENRNIIPIETDICRGTICHRYDLVVAHLLLGEAVKWGNSFSDLLEKLLDISCSYLIIVDYLDDPQVDHARIEVACAERGLVYRKMICANSVPQQFREFSGRHNFGYLIRC